MNGKNFYQFYQATHPESIIASNTLNKINKIYKVFIVTYAFLSGFVFIEPSLAEIWFVVFVPFLLQQFTTTIELLLTFSMMFIPMLFSSFFGYIILGNFNLSSLRFILIDIYLFSFFFIITSYFHNTKMKIEKQQLVDSLMRFWALAGIINIFAGLLVYFVGFNIPYANIVIYTGGLEFGIRLRGFFKDPNVLGPFLVPAAIYYLKKFFDGRKSASFLIIFVLLSTGVFLSFSRAAWLNYATAFIFYIFYAIRTKKIFSKVFFLIVFMIMLLIFTFSISKNIYLFNVNLQDFITQRMKLQSYDEDRFANQKEFVNILVSTSMLFGAGPGNYEYFTNYSTHSLYLRYIGERGFLGFIAFGFFLLLVLRKSLKSEFKSFLIPVLLGQFANSFFIDSLHWRHLWILIALSFM